jgi:hypothetical protein
MSSSPRIRRTALGLAALLLAGTAEAQLAKGTAAPSFEIKKAWNGGPRSFGEVKGQVILLEFFATW